MCVCVWGEGVLNCNGQGGLGERRRELNEATFLPIHYQILKRGFFFWEGGGPLILFRINTAEELMINNLLS